VTEALITCPPSGATETRIRRLDFARGDRRIATRKPPRIGVSGPSSKIFEHQIAQEIQQQDQDHRRNIDPAKVREEGSNRSQCRFSNSPKNIVGRSDDAVVAINDAKGEEPAQHRLSNQQPDEDCDHCVDEVKKRIHQARALAAASCGGP
jgi:hypothetical protein